MANKYNNETLTNYCNENQITLTKDYSEIKVTRDTIIHGKCINKCDKEFQKNFRRMVENSGAICLDCQKNFTSFNINFLNKFVKDNNIFLIDEYKNVTRDTKIKGKCNNNLCNNNFEKNFRYLVEEGGPYCDICTKEKKFDKFKDEMNKKYGCDYFTQCNEGKEKIKNVVIEKYGVDYISQNKEIRQKIKKTCIDKYGTENPSKTKEVKEKAIKTNLKKYGFEYPIQNPEIFEKIIKNSFRKKTFISKSGRIYICQGYEPQAIEYLIDKINIDENNILIGPSDTPKIRYKDNKDIEHTHYTDIFIKNENKILEIKSDYSLENYNYNIFEKQKAAKELGYLYEIWVMNKKGDLLEKHT
jgi:hypothetical protein